MQYLGMPLMRGVKTFDSIKRKELGLPITKQLYYHEGRYSDKCIKVLGFSIKEKHDTWSEIDLEVEGHKHIVVHSGYFRNMQSPTFVDDMRKQDAEL